jgi:hypothetical protein
MPTQTSILFSLHSLWNREACLLLRASIFLLSRWRLSRYTAIGSNLASSEEEMCLRYWELCVTEGHVTDLAAIKRVSSDKFRFTKKIARLNFMSLVGEKGYVLENPLLFLERPIKLDALRRLWLEMTYNAEVNVKCAATLINEGGETQRPGKGWGYSPFNQITIAVWEIADITQASAKQTASLPLLAKLSNLNYRSRKLKLSATALFSTQTIIEEDVI